MWRYAVLGALALLARGSEADAQHKRDNASLASSSQAPQFAPVITIVDSKEPSTTTITPPRFTFSPSKPSPPFSNTTTAHRPCTGCILEAYNAFTTFFNEEDMYNPWTSVVVTETVVTQLITYFDGSTIDTIVTSQETVNQTKTVVGGENVTITHTTPYFVVEPTPGVYLTLDAGPTYVVYEDLTGGVDQQIGSTYTGLQQTPRTCGPMPTKLKHWEPTATEDWNYFIQTYTGRPPAHPLNLPVALPSKLVEILKQDADFVAQYSGADIATCTVGIPQEATSTILPKPTAPPAIPPELSAPAPPAISEPASETETEPEETQSQTGAPELTATAPYQSVTTGTFISTTYESTSTHVTRQGCLRCAGTDGVPNPATTAGPVSNENNNNGPSPATPTYKPDEPSNPGQQPKPNETPDSNNPSPNNPNTPAGDNKPNPNQQQTAPSIPDIIVSIIYNNPDIWPQHTAADQSVTIGDNVYAVHTASPTQNNPNQPNEQNQALPAIVIGTETFYPGQTKTINGVPVVAPTEGGYSRLVVDGSTMTVPPAGPTGAPVLTLGGNTVITANPSGRFVVGTQTLSPGGSAITVSGTTYSLGPSGTVLVVNGESSTLAGSAPAVVTAAPALTINGRIYAATTIQDGTTAYVLGPGTTLTPGGSSVVISGTTYSLDSQGTALVVNGQTTSSIKGASATVPASISASTTATTVGRIVATTSSSSGRGAGDLIASGIGETSKGAAGVSRYGSSGGLDKWIEGMVVGGVGWLMVLLW